MDNETEKIFRGQLTKLPKEILSFLSSSNWSADTDEIGSLYNLSSKELIDLGREVSLVLIGLVPPDEFRSALEEEGVVTNRAVLDALVANIEKKIFAPIRPALVDFIEKEAAAHRDLADLAPNNLPTDESAESFLPKLTPKIIMPSSAPQKQEPVHPFEEKMKEFYTDGQQPSGGAAVAQVRQGTPQENLGGQAIPQTFTPQAPKVPMSGADPYREPIE